LSLAFALRIAEVLRPYDRIGPDNISLVAEIFDRRRQIGVAAGGEEAAMESEVGPEDRLRVADLHGLIMFALRRFYGLQVSLFHRKRNRLGGGALQDGADGVYL